MSSVGRKLILTPYSGPTSRPPPEPRLRQATDLSAADGTAAAAHPNQFALLRQRRFAPFFWTQFLGAGNDNLFKFAFTVMVTYQLQVPWLPDGLAGLVIGALFILPFVLFSATSGQLADKLEKTRLIRFVKMFRHLLLTEHIPLPTPSRQRVTVFL